MCVCVRECVRQVKSARSCWRRGCQGSELSHLEWKMSPSGSTHKHTLWHTVTQQKDTLKDKLEEKDTKQTAHTDWETKTEDDINTQTLSRGTGSWLHTLKHTNSVSYKRFNWPRKGCQLCLDMLSGSGNTHMHLHVWPEQHLQLTWLKFSRNKFSSWYCVKKLQTVLTLFGCVSSAAQ